MAQERPTKKRSGITGRAYVVMGGKVALGTYNENGHFGDDMETMYVDGRFFDDFKNYIKGE